MYIQQNRQVLFSNIVKWPRKKVPHGRFTWLSYLLQEVNYFCQSFIESDSSFVGPICLLVNKIGTHLYHCQLLHYLRKNISSYIQLACKFFIDIRKIPKNWFYKVLLRLVELVFWWLFLVTISSWNSFGWNMSWSDWLEAFESDCFEVLAEKCNRILSEMYVIDYIHL